MAAISTCRFHRFLKKSVVCKHLTSSLVAKNQAKHASTFTYVAETPQTDGIKYCTILIQ
jgi:hypothetical protein